MRIKNLLYWLLVILLSVTMVISGYMVFRYLADSMQQKKEYDALAELVEQARSDAASEVPPATTPTEAINSLSQARSASVSHPRQGSGP